MALLLRDRSRALRLIVLTCIVGCSLPLAASASSLVRPVVEQVTIDRRSDGLGYVIRFHTNGAVSGYTEPRRDGDALEVQLFNVALARGYAAARPAGPVLDYDAQPRGGHLVFRFHLDPVTPVEAEIYRDRFSSDLLVGLTYSGERSGALPVPVRPVASRNAPSWGPAVETAASGPAVGAPDVALRSEGERWRLDTIVIDAGHGGKDTGATANGVREKDVVLAVAHKLGAYLEENLGVRVVYTRDSDRFIGLRDRGRIANREGAKLFVSIHANAASDPRAHGTETYFLGMHKTEAARSVMDRENEVVTLESDPSHYADLTEQALIRQTLLQSANMRKSEELAARIEAQFNDRVGRKSRGVKQAGFYVLWGASMPAVLVELGFVSNREEARFMASEEGQVYMASAIFRAVKEYKESYEKGLLVHSSQR